MSIIQNGELATRPEGDEQITAAALAECEAVIERGKQTFLEVGQALARIQRDELYKFKYGTFAGYCEARWGITRQRARHYLRAFEAVESLGPPEDGGFRKSSFPGKSSFHGNEWQALALADVPPEHREEVVARVEKSGRKVTARAIKAEAAAMAAPPKAASGVVVPDGERFEQVGEALNQISRLFNAILDGPEGFFLLAERQRIEADIRNLRTAFKTLRPAGECSYCKGRGKYRGKTCDGCKGQGWCCVGVAKAAPKVMEAESIFEADDSDELERLAMQEVEAQAERESMGMP